MSETIDVSAEIERANNGDIGPLVEVMKGRPTSPSGFVKTRRGSFGDGEMADRTWMQVEVAAMSGQLSLEQYEKVYDALLEPHPMGWCRLDHSPSRPPNSSKPPRQPA